MEKVIDLMVRLIRAGRRAYTKKLVFFSLFSLMFFGSIAVLASFDLLPEKVPTKTVSATTLPEVSVSVLSKTVEAVELPIRIEIPALNLSVGTVNPTTTSIAVLDEALLKGAVRYPTSAKLGEVGNVVLFGHSSYLPIVGNQAYKSFNGIQKLMRDDVIIVYSASTAYTYRVRSVAKEDASNAGIALSVTGRVLTLATCDSFGAKPASM